MHISHTNVKNVLTVYALSVTGSWQSLNSYCHVSVNSTVIEHVAAVHSRKSIVKVDLWLVINHILQ